MKFLKYNYDSLFYKKSKLRLQRSSDICSDLTDYSLVMLFYKFYQKSAYNSIVFVALHDQRDKPTFIILVRSKNNAVSVYLCMTKFQLIMQRFVIARDSEFALLISIVDNIDKKNRTTRVARFMMLLVNFIYLVGTFKMFSRVAYISNRMLWVIWIFHKMLNRTF